MTLPASTTVEDLPLEQLQEWARNPRRISKPRLEALKRALVAEPEMLRARPLIALPDGTVVAGNQRLRAARELGWPSLPVVVVDLDEARAAEWALRDNRPYGEDDEALVGALLAELAADGRALDLTGYDSGEVDRLLAAVRPAPAVDPDEAPPLPAEHRSVRGEVYDLGPHRLMCGDATSEADVAALVGSCRPEVLWTDPPYGVKYVGKTKAALTIAGDLPEGVLALLVDVFALAADRLAPAARFYVAAPAGPRGSDFRTALATVGWQFHQALVWVKDVFVLGHSDHHYRHEDVLYGWTPGDGRPGRGKHTGTRWYGDNASDTVFEIPRPRASREHPTMKPAALVESHLVNSSKVGDHVLDPFAGSGTTLIACEQLGRRALCMEIDPAYCDVIRQRYADFTGQPELAP